MKHVPGGQALRLCAYLPHWPIDRLCRRRPELRHKPLVLVQTSGQRQTIVHTSPQTPTGIYPGMALTEARARCAELIDLPATPVADLRSLEALGHWLIRFSPNVCVDPPASIFLDATGLERLFGGLANLHRHMVKALAALRISAAVTIAPTAGAAWALAAFSDNAPHLVTNDQILSALAPLPPEALRLPSRTISLLASLGVRTIRSLLQLSRNDLALRFGPTILTRIDQATGAAHEPLTWLTHRIPIRATLEFEGAIESLEAIHFAIHELTRQITAQLAARGQGARELRLIFHQPYAPPIEKLIRLVRPCRNESALARLIGCALENLQAGEGFVAATLIVSASQRLGDQQAALIGGEEERSAAELDELVERLRARLDHGVEWGELLESNLPENTSRCRDSAAPINASTGDESIASASTADLLTTNILTTHAPAPNVSSANAANARRVVDLFRPIRLLRQPRPIKVMVRPSESREGHPVSFTDRGEIHRLDHIRGPERITGQWWNGRWKIRDYFDVLDAAGDRYWIFRVAPTGRWFLHGIFE